MEHTNAEQTQQCEVVEEQPNAISRYYDKIVACIKSIGKKEQPPKEEEDEKEEEDDYYSFANTARRMAWFNLHSIDMAEKSIKERREREQYEREHPEEMGVYHPDYMRLVVHSMD
jgi:hypothetical protein